MHAAIGPSWKPTQPDLERFIGLRERELTGAQLDADERAFVGQFADFTVDAVRFKNNTQKKAIKNGLRTGDMTEERSFAVEVASFKVPEIPENRKLEALLQKMVETGEASTQEIRDALAQVGKLSRREDASLQPSLAALNYAQVLTPDQVKEIETWLEGALSARKGHADKWDFVARVSRVALVALLMGGALFANMQFGPEIAELGKLGEFAARLGIGLGALGVGLLAFGQVGKFIAKHVMKYGDND